MVRLNMTLRGATVTGTVTTHVYFACPPGETDSNYFSQYVWKSAVTEKYIIRSMHFRAIKCIVCVTTKFTDYEKITVFMFKLILTPTN
jgi:hypothetical protein